MAFDHYPVLRACRRSRIKQRILHALTTNHELLLMELVDIVGTTPARVVGAMDGDGEEFRYDSALIALGVARRRRSNQGDVFSITSHGRYAWRRIRPRLPRGALRADPR